MALRRCVPVDSSDKPQHQRMGIIGRKRIAVPWWVSVSIAVAVAAVLTLVAFLLTLDASVNLGAKAVLAGSVLVLPLVVAANSDWPLGVSLGFAFATYFCVSFAAVWLFTREKRRESAGQAP